MRIDVSVRAKPIFAENMIFLGSDVPIFHAVTKTSCDIFTSPVILSEKYLQTRPRTFQDKHLLEIVVTRLRLGCQELSYTIKGLEKFGQQKILESRRDYI
ncbi:hypothetical protein CARUB_v10010729mg [Capsella rubella]|uniref:Uncharacterized protein n=1 Tax=Capsella rubella TaxID=81985 RepID=R0IJM2_9BRAS|nr:hypothetical protein CARUB_v10010729mg [Capsella rubella]EOA38696.1 hypothetical protein CARUB_v10010729mg [Capsella rubella]